MRVIKKVLHEKRKTTETYMKAIAGSNIRMKPSRSSGKPKGITSNS